MKFSITSTFDFDKLLKNWNKEVNPKVSSLSAKDTAKQWKANIDKGLKPKLKQSTLDIRKKNNISGDLPLKATGKLYNSIKADNNKIKYESYGLEHQKGYKVFFHGKDRVVPARQWQSKPGLSKESSKEVVKLIKDSLKADGGKKVLYQSK